MDKNVVVVGNFDGCHVGHREVFRTAVRLAAERGCGTIAFTFSNHPKNFFDSTHPVQLIRSNEQKQEIMLDCGIDRVVSVAFDAPFASMSALEFLTMLKQRFGCVCVVCGENFRFGHNGEGSRLNIDAYAQQVGCDVCVVPLQKDASGQVISSSRIRKCIRSGRVEEARVLLGSCYQLTGQVQSGRHFGRTMGFPTINFIPSDLFVLPRFGVYCTATVLDGRAYLSVTNVGVCPTVTDLGRTTVETHIMKPLFTDVSSTLAETSKTGDHADFAMSAVHSSHSSESGPAGFVMLADQPSFFSEREHAENPVGCAVSGSDSESSVEEIQSEQRESSVDPLKIQQSSSLKTAEQKPSAFAELGDLYGKQAQVAFVSFIRPEQKFDSKIQLQQQISSDRESALSKFDEVCHLFMDFK